MESAVQGAFVGRSKSSFAAESRYQRAISGRAFLPGARKSRKGTGCAWKEKRTRAKERERVREEGGGQKKGEAHASKCTHTVRDVINATINEQRPCVNYGYHGNHIPGVPTASERTEAS